MAQIVDFSDLLSLKETLSFTYMYWHTVIAGAIFIINSEFRTPVNLVPTECHCKGNPFSVVSLTLTNFPLPVDLLRLKKTPADCACVRAAYLGLETMPAPIVFTTPTAGGVTHT